MQNFNCRNCGDTTSLGRDFCKIECSEEYEDRKVLWEKITLTSLHEDRREEIFSTIMLALQETTTRGSTCACCYIAASLFIADFDRVRIRVNLNTGNVVIRQHKI